MKAVDIRTVDPETLVFRHADEAEKVVKMLEDYGSQAV